MAGKIMKSGMNREEILTNSDTKRRQVNDYVAAHPGMTVRKLAEIFDIEPSQMRGYVKYLVKEQNLRTIHKIPVSKTYYESTGKPYVSPPIISKYHQKLATPEPTFPGARVFKLLDRKPIQLTPEERMRQRKERKSRMYGVRGSSMQMFDSW